MVKRINVAMLLMLLLAPAVFAQTADDLVGKYVQARGGIDKLKAIQSLRMTGTMTTGALEVPITMLMKRPNMVRMEFEVQGMTGVRAYDGQRGWTLMPFLGSPDPAPISGKELQELEDQADLDGGLVDYKAKGNSVELLGKEKVDGVDAYKLKLTRKNGDVDTIYLDAGSYLEIREDGQHTVQGSLKDFETRISDYREVNGVNFPYAILSGIKGAAEQQKLVIDKVEANTPIEMTLFKMPAAAAETKAP